MHYPTNSANESYSNIKNDSEMRESSITNSSVSMKLTHCLVNM